MPYTPLYLLYFGLIYLIPSLLSSLLFILFLIILTVALSELILNFDKMDLDSLIGI